MYAETQDRQIQVMTTVYCTVKYDFLQEEIVIPVVNPQSEDDFTTAFSNREISEKRKIGLIE